MYRQIGIFDDNTIATIAIFDDQNRKISFTSGDFENNEFLTDIHEYDDKSRLVRSLSSDGYWIEMNYNKDGSITETDSKGMIREVDNQSDVYIKYKSNSVINPADNVIALIKQSTQKELIEGAKYDDKNRLIEKLNWDNQVIRYTYKDI